MTGRLHQVEVDPPHTEALRREVERAESEAARLREELEQVEWLADYDRAEVAGVSLALELA